MSLVGQKFYHIKDGQLKCYQVIEAHENGYFVWGRKDRVLRTFFATKEFLTTGAFKNKEEALNHLNARFDSFFQK